jgi:ketosteroid isomerase-like protein
MHALQASRGAAAADDDEAAVRAADARYRQAYNARDMRTMGELLTDEAAFYHDKTGLTASRPAVLQSLRNSPCADPAMHRRREAVADSLQLHPLAGGLALLSGTHRFYVQRDGTPERLDGQAESPIHGKRSTAIGACAASTAMRTARWRTWRLPRT